MTAAESPAAAIPEPALYAMAFRKCMSLASSPLAYFQRASLTSAVMGPILEDATVRYGAADDRRRHEGQRNNVGHALIWLLVIVVLVLGVAALVKYLRS